MFVGMKDMRVSTQLKDIVSFSKGKQINGKELFVSGKYDYLNGGVLPSGKWNEYNTAGETVTISEGGNSCGFVNFMEKPFWCGAHCYYLFEPKINAKYLYYALKSQQSKLMKIRSGACMPNIKKNDLGKFEIVYDTDSNEQFKTIKVLDTVSLMIVTCRKQLQKLDELVKSRFIEMFGDPLINSLGLTTKPMTEVCEIIDGDRGKNYPSADEFMKEGYCLFLNTKNVTFSGFNFDNCMFISKEKDEALRKGKLTHGDVVLTTRGTLGNLAFYTEKIPFEHVRINSGMVILRMKQDIVNEIYFIEQFKMQLADIKEKIASGSAQPQLPISTMNKIQLIIPNIEKQNQFADFVRQIDKSKLSVQQALDKAQILFDSLMQKYFG